MTANSQLINGCVATGFEEVKNEFTRNFSKRGELGAACTVYYKGEKVVDLWGGYRDEKTKARWEENTLAPVFSTTKGLASMAVAHAHSNGLIDYDALVVDYWPEFGQNGKENVTVRQLLSHQAGLCVIDEPLDLDNMGDPEWMAEALAKQKPAWEPGANTARTFANPAVIQDYKSYNNVPVILLAVQRRRLVRRGRVVLSVLLILIGKWDLPTPRTNSVSICGTIPGRRLCGRRRIDV